jgi:orotate phosphoribosyltransferase
MNNLESLERLLIERSVKTGHFILASGKASSIYIDARLTTMSPEGMQLIGPLALEQIETAGWNPDSIGGLTLGADPVSFAISYASAARQKPLRAFSVRKEAKTHGTENLIEGPFSAHDRVVVVEDVITTGKSALQAIDAVRRQGAEVVGVLAVVDREEGGVKAIKNSGCEVISLTSIRSLTTSAF